MGTPVTEILARVMGWISTNASSKLLYLPLRCFYSSFTALVDCAASHNFISEDLVNQIGTVTPTIVKPMPVQQADQSIMTSDYFVTLPIRFTPYHVCNIAFCIVPTLTHSMLLGIEWFSSFSLVVNWTSWVVTLTINTTLYYITLYCITLHHSLLIIHHILYFLYLVFPFYELSFEMH